MELRVFVSISLGTKFSALVADRKLKLTINILLDALMRQNRATIDIDLVAYRDIVPKNRHVLQPCPSADTAVPADDRALDPGVVFHFAVLEYHAALQPDPVSDHDIRADRDVGSDTAVLPDSSCLVDEDVPAVDKRFGSGCEGFGLLF